MAKFSYGNEVDAGEYLQGINGSIAPENDEGIDADVYLGKPNLSAELKRSTGYTILPGGEMMPNPDRPPGAKRLSAALGAGYKDEDFVDAPGDLALTFKLGKAETEAKAKEIIQSKYTNGNIRKLDLGEDGEYWIATKDGKTWKNVSDLSKMPADVISGAGIGSMLLGGPGFGGIAKSTIGTVVGSLSENQALKSWWEPERNSSAEYAVQDAAFNVLGEAATKAAVVPAIKRMFGVEGSPGAKQAIEASKPMSEGGLGLLPITGGQFTENKILQQGYRQYQTFNTKPRVEALKRFKSLKDDGLLKWINEDPSRINAFSKAELEAMTENAAFNIEKGLVKLSTGSSPLGAVLPTLQSSLDVFNKGASKRNSTLYGEAFDKAIVDDVVLSFKGVKEIFDKIELGTPVKTDNFKNIGISDSIGSAGGSPVEEMIPERYLTPDAELSRLIAKGRNVSDLLSTINPDYDFVGSLQQIEAIRRGFSEFAWENAGNNQGRLATEVLDAIDSSIANPVSGYSKDYASAFKTAQESYGTWKAIKEIKGIARLESSDISTYKNYVAALAKPGNGPVAELMQEMFKGTPEAMESVRSTFIDHLVRNPQNIQKTIDDLSTNDPRLLNVLIPNTTDRKLLVQSSKELERLNRSYMIKMREMSDLSLAQKAVNFYSGNKEEILNRVEDFTKFGGPSSKEALQAGFLEFLMDKSETEVSTELGDRVISAGTLASLVDEFKPVIDAVFDNPEASTRMKMLYDYAIKIKDTGVGIPRVKGSDGGGSDFATSLAAGAQGQTILGVPEKLSKGAGVISTARNVFAPFVSSGLMAKIINFDGPIASDKLGGKGLQERTYASIQNVLKVAPIYYSQTLEKEKGSNFRPVETGEDAFLP